MKKILGKIRRIFSSNKPLVTVVRLEGVIASKSAGRKNINLDNLESLLEQAFAIDYAKAVAVIVNSPGGSPVQSDLIAAKLRHLAAKKKKQILVFCEDAAASGGYWLACAGDEIYAAPASIVGSIGVLYSGFGFDELIKRYGVQRRIYSQGDRKVQLDPFSPENQEDIDHIKELQANIHDYFKQYVRERRGDKLKGADDELFSGQFWTGQQALPLGLVDGLGNLEDICRKKFGDDVIFKKISAKSGFSIRSLLESKFNLFGGDIAAQANDVFVEKSYWSRLGL